MNEPAASLSRPEDLDQAWGMLRSTERIARPAWTGPRPLHPDDDPAELLVDLGQLRLTFVDDSDPDQVRIGSATTLSELQRAPAAAALFSGILRRAVRKTAHHGLRNLATVGGALERPGEAPEISAALLACGAEALIYQGERERLDLSQYFDRVQAGAPSLLLELRLDAGLGRSAAAASAWIGRSPMDRAIVAAAASLQVDGGSIQAAALSLAGDGIAPQRLAALEGELAGAQAGALERSAIEQAVRQAVRPEDSFRASGEYQRHLAAVLIWRALRAAITEAT